MLSHWSIWSCSDISPSRGCLVSQREFYRTLGNRLDLGPVFHHCYSLSPITFSNLIMLPSTESAGQPFCPNIFKIFEHSRFTATGGKRVGVVRMGGGGEAVLNYLDDFRRAVHKKCHRVSLEQLK